MRTVLPLVAALGLLCGCVVACLCFDAFTPPRPSGAARLRFERMHVAVGLLPAGSERRISLRWRCVGTGTLRIAAVRPDCGCLATSGLPAQLSAGDEGTLRLRVRAPRAPGPFRSRLRIFSGRTGPLERQCLIVTGAVGSEEAGAAGAWRIRPAAVDLGRQPAGAQLTRLLQVEALEAPDRLEARLVGVAGRTRVRPALGGAFPGCSVVLELRLPAAVGPGAGFVELSSAGSAVRRIPVRFETVGCGGGPRPRPAGRRGPCRPR